MKRSNSSRMFGPAILGLIAFGCHDAKAQRFGPDQLQTLGVGSRAVAMGDAYAAIADDASATFWNPGRLGFLTDRQFMFSFRNVDNNFARQSFPASPADGGSFRSGDFQPGFGSFVYPLHGNGIKAGSSSIGISYTLGGYYNLDRTTNSFDANGILTTKDVNTRVSNSFITIAYGVQIKKGFGIGAGVYFLNQDFSKNTTQTNTLPVLDSEKGRGYGINLGLCYDWETKHSRNSDGSIADKDYFKTYSLALAYRTQAQISQLAAAGRVFNDELPGRLNLGFALTQNIRGPIPKWKTGEGQPSSGTVSLEFQVLQAANRSRDALGNLNLTDARRAVGDVHVGFEYIPSVLKKPYQYKIPLRAGFRTNSNAATQYSYYDNVVSFGFAYLALNRANYNTYSIEPTVELFTSNGAVNYTMTAQFHF